MDALLKFGEEEQVWSLLRDAHNCGEVFEAGKGYPYSEFIARTLEKHGVVPLPSMSDYGMYNPDAYRCTSLICFYNRERKLIQEKIEDTGALLQKLRPDPNETDVEFYILPTPPIYIFGDIWDDKAIIRIELHTDIWFPWVKGFLDDPSEFPTHYDPQRKMFDNRILANCHTVRLNRFLEKVRELTLNHEGIWHGVDGAAGIRDYVSQLGDVGIRLD
ncbi:MAG: hypothetical protein HY862_08960 [Chloroflexi bacterium]|nr:hypothetical protein [Chloroflexota bacterium]